MLDEYLASDGNNATAKTYVTGVGIFIYTAKVAIYTAKKEKGERRLAKLDEY